MAINTTASTNEDELVIKSLAGVDAPVVSVGVSVGFPMPMCNFAPWVKKDVYMVQGKGAHLIAEAAKIKPDGVNYFGELNDESFVTLFFQFERKAEADQMAKLLAKPEWAENAAAKLTIVFHATGDTFVPASQYDNTYTVLHQSFGGRGDWQPWQLITLPSLVAAYARYQGWKVTPLQFRAISDPKNVQVSTEEEIGALWAEYLLQRQQLWAELGEDDVKACLSPTQKDKNGNPIKIGVTTSRKLAAALDFANGTWSGKIYPAMGVVGHPRMNATEKAKTSRIPVCSDIMATKEEAEAFVAERKARAEARRAEAGEVETEKSVVDSRYADLYIIEDLSGDEFASALMTDLMPLVQAAEEATGANKIKANKAVDAMVEQFGLTKEQGQAWIDFLKKQ